MQFSRQDLPARFWGLADALRLFIYVAHEVIAGRVPFLGSLQMARDTADLVGPLAIVISSLGAVLILSLALSAALLLGARSSGAWLSFIQAPFRVFLVYPSIYIPPVVGGLFGHFFGISVGSAIFFAFIAVLEIARVWSLVRWLKLRRASTRAAGGHAA